MKRLSYSFSIYEKYVGAIITFFLLMITNGIAADVQDSLILKNGDIIVGEIKTMDKGVITIETDYSDKDFEIEWLGVKEVHCNTRFLITLKNGDRMNGTFYTVDSGKALMILAQKNEPDTATYSIKTTLDDVVYLKGLKSDFWSRAYASVAIGFSMTRANNLRQWSGRTNVGYIADKWLLDAFYDDMRSQQDSISDTRRTEAGVKYNYYLPKDWYAGASLNFLSNTEQALQLRINGKLGMGKFLIHTNKKYWSAVGSLSFHKKTFTNKTPARTSLEGYFGSELSLFDVGDLSLFNSVYVYPSFTESGRWRSDIKLDTKYEFPMDFFVKLGLTFNYDNQPAIVGKETDYVFSFTLGWEL